MTLSMVRRTGVAVACACAVALSSPSAGQQPVFRSGTSGVAVPVLVLADRKPVLDLSATDFVLTDSGVRQAVTLMTGATVPLDVTIVLQQTLRVEWFRTKTFQDEVAVVARLLREGERLRIVSTLDEGRDLVTMSTPSETVEISVARSGCHNLYDTLARVLMTPVELGRQHLVVVMVAGDGGGGALTTGVVADLALRTGAQVHVHTWEPSWGRTTWRTAMKRAMCTSVGVNWDPERRNRLRAISGIRDPDDQARELWLDARDRLVKLATSTGGGEIRSGIFSRSIAGPVQQVLEAARSRYLLYYTPTGVPAGGWHPITVTVTRPGRYEVQARPGYAR